MVDIARNWRYSEELQATGAVVRALFSEGSRGIPKLAPQHIGPTNGITRQQSHDVGVQEIFYCFVVLQCSGQLADAASNLGGPPMIVTRARILASF